MLCWKRLGTLEPPRVNINSNHQVDKKDLTSSDPYLKMARVLETGEQTYIFKTEVQSRTLNPVWREIQV